MLFGDTDSFGIEAIVEPGPEYPPISGSNLNGRVRLWVSGYPIGDFDEPSCWLGPVADHLLTKVTPSTAAWDDSLSELTPTEIFIRLDYLLFAYDQQLQALVDPDQVPEAPKALELSGFLTNVSEAFDGWKCFLVDPSESSVLILVQSHSDEIIRHYWIPRNLFSEIALQFVDWVKATRSALIASS